MSKSQCESEAAESWYYCWLKATWEQGGAVTVSQSTFSMFLCETEAILEEGICKSVSSFSPSITANEMAMCSLVWMTNLTFMPSQYTLSDQGCQRIQGDGPQCHKMHRLCVLKALRRAVRTDSSLQNLSEFVCCSGADEIWPPPGSHLAPNWGMLLVSSAFTFHCIIAMVKSESKWLCCGRKRVCFRDFVVTAVVSWG